MTQCAYTVDEIDDLRREAPSDIMRTNGGWMSYKGEGDKARQIEERVRTYMVAGITADDLRLTRQREHDAWLEQIQREKVRHYSMLRLGRILLRKGQVTLA